MRSYFHEDVREITTAMRRVFSESPDFDGTGVAPNCIDSLGALALVLMSMSWQKNSKGRELFRRALN
jgi:hypothetical protein